MVSTPEGCNDNITMTPNQSDPTKTFSAIKSLRQFSEALGVKHRTAVCGLGVAKANNESIRTGNVMC